MGELTRAAADEAKSDLGLSTESDRSLLATLESALETIEIRVGVLTWTGCRPIVRTIFRPGYDLDLKLTLMWVKTCRQKAGRGVVGHRNPAGSSDGGVQGGRRRGLCRRLGAGR